MLKKGVPLFKYCPSCGSLNISFDGKNRFSCPDCGFVYYQNTAAATGCIISVGSGPEAPVLFLVRNREPSKGKLAFPGGFVDPKEGALEGLRRECQEELGWDPDSQGAKFAFLASFPNIYPYRDVVYHTCDLFFTIAVPGLTEEVLKPDPDETQGVRFIRPSELDPADLAFDSTRRALQAYNLEFLKEQNALKGFSY
jgi:ADP-ribose pyrophosphatase YjhB (NUDIX family)